MRPGLNPWIKVLLLPLLLIAVSTALSRSGTGSRRFLAAPQVRSVTTNLEAYRLWEASGVRGRVLLLMARHARFYDHESSRPAENNFLSPALKSGFFRRIYQQVPAGGWGEVRGVLAGSPSLFIDLGNHFRAVLTDSPVVIAPLSQLPHLDERVVVHVDESDWTERELDVIVALLKERQVPWDLVVFRGTHPRTKEWIDALLR